MARTAKLEPGTRVKVVQTVQRREGEWTTEVEGVVVEHEARQTGSWHAHARKGRLWLNRLTLRKDDGELVRLNLEENTQVIPCNSSPESRD